ncbi:hypothetical protein EMG21_33150, partial [Klebsiella pneumoniae]
MDVEIKRKSFWTPGKLGMIGFFLAVTFIAVYGAYTGREIQWGGVLFLLFFYALVYYIGAVTGRKKSNDLKDMMLAG